MVMWCIRKQPGFIVLKSNLLFLFNVLKIRSILIVKWKIMTFQHSWQFMRSLRDIFRYFILTIDGKEFTLTYLYLRLGMNL